MGLNKLRSLKKSDAEMEQKFREDIEAAGGLEKNDMKAMIIAGLITVMPVVLGIFLLFVLFAWLFI